MAFHRIFELLRVGGLPTGVVGDTPVILDVLCSFKTVTRPFTGIVGCGELLVRVLVSLFDRL